MTSSPNPHSKPHDRQEYQELDIDQACAKGFDIFSPKYDGIWARVEIGNQLAQVFSRTGQLKETFGVPAVMECTEVKTTLVGEYMYGSQWALKEGREGKIFLFDIIELEDEGLWNLNYSTRYRKLLNLYPIFGDRFELAPVYKGLHLHQWWQDNERKNGFEGVVCRNWFDTWQHSPVKVKRTVEDDFIIIGFEPGKGRLDGTLGALILGQYDEKGVLREVMTCGGGLADNLRDLIWQDKNLYLHKVVLIQGKGRFDSGALRHPNFLQFRSDKYPHECRLKDKLQS